MTRSEAVVVMRDGWRHMGLQEMRCEAGIGRCWLVHGPQQDERDGVLVKELPSTWRSEVWFDREAQRFAVSLDGARQSMFDGPDPAENARAVTEEVTGSVDSVVLDVTSISVPSLFLLLQALSGKGIRTWAGYVEPVSYDVGTHREEFALSVRSYDISPIPGFTRELRGSPEASSLYAFLGFEGARFLRVVEYFQRSDMIHPIIPLPSYQAGWHLLALHGNLRALLQSEAFANARRVTAFDPFEALRVLEELYEQRQPEEGLLVAPLGTKPHSLAVGVFAVRHPDVVVVYDHPVPRRNRSIGVSRVRGYDLTGLLER